MASEEISGRRIVVRKFGGPEVLETVEETVPAPSRGHVRLKVLTAGVGYTDIMARSGDYLLQRKTPFTPGYELVGEVVDGEGFAPGTKVVASLPKMGAYREYVVLPSWVLVPLPDGLDPNLAATIPLDYLTASSVLRHAKVNKGDTVLIQGAAGGVGQALSQLGKLNGLRMYGTASAASSKERLARFGVRFIDYRTEDFETVLREREPGGVQGVFDSIAGANLAKGYRLLAPGGVLVSYGFSGRPGHIVGDTLRAVVDLQLRGLRPGKRTALTRVPAEIKSDREWYRHSLQRLLTMARDGDIQAETGAVASLQDVADVHRALERREITGKVVLTTH